MLNDTGELRNALSLFDWGYPPQKSDQKVNVNNQKSPDNVSNKSVFNPLQKRVKICSPLKNSSKVNS